MRWLSLLFLICTILSTAHAQQSTSTERLLNCWVGEQLPPDPAQAEEGGYRFEYQSFRGVTEDGRVCTLYRLRNTEAKPPTPVRWVEGEELLMDKVRLARCAAEVQPCTWLSVAKYFEGSVDTNLSVISYGLNADAYTQQAETFLSLLAPDASRDTHSVGTELQGVFASVTGGPVAVHLIAKSRVEPGTEGKSVVVLEVSDLSESGSLAAGHLRIAWDALADIEAAATLLATATADEVVGFIADRKSGETSSIENGVVSRTPQTLEVSFPVQAYDLRRDYRLSVYYRDETEPIITVEMPAFVPKDALQ